MKSVDTPDPHHNGKLGFRGDVVVAMLAGVTGQTHFVVLSLAILFNVLLGTLKDGGALGFGLSENKTDALEREKNVSNTASSGNSH